MNDLTTAFGNPLSLLVLLPIVAGATLMLVAWAAPPSQRKDLTKHVRLISFGLSLLAVVLSFVGMLVLHELGHFVVARWTGMQVTEFFIGFGPRVWSVNRGETEYGVKAIPLGAYVRVTGMTNLDEVDPALEHRTYRHQSFLLPKQLLMMEWQVT